MKIRLATMIPVVALLGVPLSHALAAEGASSGNGSSTLAAPASANKGPTKSGSMSSGHMMKTSKHRHHHM